jgi:hypothetical protein
MYEQSLHVERFLADILLLLALVTFPLVGVWVKRTICKAVKWLYHRWRPVCETP